MRRSGFSRDTTRDLPPESTPAYPYPAVQPMHENRGSCGMESHRAHPVRRVKRTHGDRKRCRDARIGRIPGSGAGRQSAQEGAMLRGWSNLPDNHGDRATPKGLRVLHASSCSSCYLGLGPRGQALQFLGIRRDARPPALARGADRPSATFRIDATREGQISAKDKSGPRNRRLAGVATRVSRPCRAEGGGRPGSGSIRHRQSDSGGDRRAGRGLSALGCSVVVGVAAEAAPTPALVFRQGDGCRG